MGKVLFFVTFFLAYTIQAITGFAGNMLAMPVGMNSIGFSDTVVVLNLCGCLSCGTIAVLGWKHIDWHEFRKCIFVMIAFMILGIWLDTIVPFDALVLIYGIVVLGIGLKNLIFKKPLILPEWALWIVIVLAGIIQGMYVSGGAFLVIYAVQKIKDKEAFRTTLSLIWAVLNGMYAGIAGINGSFTPSSMNVFLVCIPLFVIATFFGNWLSKRVGQGFFLKLTYALLVIIGLLLIFT